MMVKTVRLEAGVRPGLHCGCALHIQALQPPRCCTRLALQQVIDKYDQFNTLTQSNLRIKAGLLVWFGWYCDGSMHAQSAYEVVLPTTVNASALSISVCRPGAQQKQLLEKSLQSRTLHDCAPTLTYSNSKYWVKHEQFDLAQAPQAMLKVWRWTW